MYPEFKRDYECEWPLYVLLRQAVVAKWRKIQCQEVQLKQSMYLHNFMCMFADDVESFSQIPHAG